METKIIITIGVIIIIILVIVLVVIYIRKPEKLEIKPLNFTNLKLISTKPSFSDFSKYVDLAETTYGLSYKIDDNASVIYDSTGNSTYIGGDIIDLSKPLNSEILRTIDIIKRVYGLSDFQILYGHQNMVYTYRTGIYGFIAKDKDGNGIVSFRGTNTTRDWITDVNFGEIKLSDIIEFKTFINSSYSSIKDNLTGFRGFTILYGIERVNDSCISSQINKWVLEHPEINNYKLCGHSLGAALATLATFHINLILNKNTESYLFASPRVLNRETCSIFNQKCYLTTYNFFNVLDIIHQALLPVMDMDEALIGFDIPIVGTHTSGCFQHAGTLLGIEYSRLGLPPTKQVLNFHSVTYGYKSMKNEWKRKLFDIYIDIKPNPVTSIEPLLKPYEKNSKPTYIKFIEYSTILDSLYNSTELFNNYFFTFIGFPSRLLNQLNTVASKYNITNISPIFITGVNTIFPNQSYFSGFIGKYKGKGLLLLGMNYKHFPTKLAYDNEFIPSFLEAVPFNKITFKRTDINTLFQNTKIAEVFQRLYFDACPYNTCIKDNINKWLLANKDVNNFIIIGQNAGCCFATLASLHLYNEGKKIIESYLYGSPKVGDNTFVNAYNTILGNQTYQFLNNQDPYVTILPYITNIFGELFSKEQTYVYEHTGKLYICEGIPPDSECDYDYLMYVRNPRAYLNVPQWESVITRQF
jgi:predicted lipase